MGLLPDINDDGTLKEDKLPNVYTPKEMNPPRREGWEIRHDTHGTHIKDAPTMDNLHECVPDNDSCCQVCGRFMLV